MTIHCPCCGTPVNALPLEQAMLSLTPLMQRIVRQVERRPGISRAALADAVYADDPDGGPMWAEKTVSVTIAQQRDKLAAAGWQLVSRPRGAYRLEVAA
jgi:hypothetical protein